MCQVEPTGGRVVFGVLLESQAISQFQFENDLLGLLTTSAADDYPLMIRIEGTDCMIEVASLEEPLRVRDHGTVANDEHFGMVISDSGPQ